MSYTSSSLDNLMARASLGDREATHQFLSLLLRKSFFVPERYSNTHLAGGTLYPNVFFSMLGITSGDRTTIPFFSHFDHVVEWAGDDLECREVSAAQLLGLTPHQWWLCLNPGQDIEKEFSPWEIALLRSGEEQIPEVVDELFSDDSLGALRVSEPGIESFLTLRSALRKYGESDPQVRRVYLLQEEPAEPHYLDPTPLVGVVLQPQARSHRREALSAIEAVCQQAHSGDIAPKVTVATLEEPDFMLRLFLLSTPLFERAAERIAPWGLSFFRRRFS